MKVLSLFDWIACGYEALLRAQLPIDKYFASEIDKYAIQVAMKNHPDIIQVWDVCKLTYHDWMLFMWPWEDKDWPYDSAWVDWPIDLIIGWSPCFTKWTKVWTYDWYKDISEVEVWDYVIWLGWEYNRVLKTWWQTKEIWSIKWQWFLETLTTENHPYYVSKCKRVWHDSHRELQEPKWVEVKDIEVWDYVWLPIIHDNKNIKWITFQEARLLWRYMADWHTRKDYRKWTTRRYYQVIYSVWDEKLWDFNHIDEYHITKNKHSQSVHRFVISSKRLTELCEDIWCWAINKSIPKWILDLPRELLIEFFKWYVAWDWYYKWKWVWKCSTISRDMAMSLCLLSATLFHTWAQIHYTKRPKKHIIQWRVVNQNDSYEVIISEYKKPQDHYMTTEDYIWVPIKEIKSMWYEDVVYNLEVENSNSYTANNVVVHNCQWFSMAGKMLNFNDPRSKLFFEFVRLVKECKPKFFLLENVKMKRDFIAVINEQLWWITPTQINSSLVSAQNRVRNYWVWKLQDDWTYTKVEIPQPEDRWILLKDILETNVDESLYFTEAKIQQVANRKCHEKPLQRVKTWEDKSDTLTTHCWKDSWWMKLVGIPCGTQLGNSKSWWNSYWSNKAYTLRACNPNGVIEWATPLKIRKLTPIECERLQTLPSWYTEWISTAQRYKALGNWWTVEVISYIFSHLK